MGSLSSCLRLSIVSFILIGVLNSGCNNRVQNLSVAKFPEIRALIPVSQESLWTLYANGEIVVVNADQVRPVRSKFHAVTLGRVDNDTVVAFDSEGSVWKTDIVDIEWEEIGSIGPDALITSSCNIQFVDAANGFFLDAFNLWGTGDAGHNWQRLSDFSKQLSGGSVSYKPIAFHAIDLDTIWVVFSNGMVLVTTDGGRSWLEVPLESSSDIRSVFARDSRTAVIGTWNNGGLYRTGDSGKSWARIQVPELPSPFGVSAIHFISPNVGWVLATKLGTGPSQTQDVGLLISHDGGRTWNLSDPLGDADSVRGIVFYDSATGWIVGDSQFYRTVDGGKSWTSVGKRIRASVNWEG